MFLVLAECNGAAVISPAKLVESTAACWIEHKSWNQILGSSIGPVSAATFPVRGAHRRKRSVDGVSSILSLNCRHKNSGPGLRR